MLRHDGYISLCLNIRLVGVTIHYCTAECLIRILTCECVLVMADSNKRFTGESDFERPNSHDPVNPLAAVEESAPQPESAGTPPDGIQDLPLLKKKPTSFQITSVTVQGSRLSTDGGDDSADDLDESHTEDLSSDVLDISRTTDPDNDPLSEENSNNAAGDAVKSIPVKQAPESQPPKLDTPTAESDAPSSNMQSVPTVLPTSATPDVISNTKSTEPTNESATKAPTIPDQWQHRFKVVKIVSSQPYKRGRWLCMDFMDPPSVQSSEAKSEVPPEAMTNVTVGSGSHAETVMCGTQTTNNVAHVYEIPPNESYPGSISVTVCPQPIQQPFYGIFLPLNNSQMPDMSAMPSGFAQDSTRKFESSVPSMQPITVGFINQPSQFPHMGSSMQQAHSFVGGNNKSYDKGSTQSQSYVSQQPQQQQQPTSQSFVPQSQQQQSHVTQSQNFTSQPPQTTQTQSFIQQPTPQIMSSTPQVMSSAPQVMSSATSVQNQSISHPGVQQPPTTHSVTETPMQVTQGGSSAVPLAMSVPQQASSMEQIVSMQQSAAGVTPSAAYNSQNLVHASGASETVPMTIMSSVVQTMPTATTVVSGNNIPPANVPPSIPDNLISSNMQQTSKEVHNVPSQLHYNHVDARDNTQSSITPPVAESLPEVSASKAPAEETESVPSGSNTVAIDNKIEQAMDLVKSHLMFAVREEVDVLKEKITELVERISLLEYENTFLKANASQETLSQLNQSQQLHQQQQQQQQQQTQNAAATQGQQNLQSQQPTL